MFAKYLFAFAIVALAYCVPAEQQVRVSLEPAKPEDVKERALPKDWKTTFASVSKYVPTDDGVSNYGDLKHLSRQNGDGLLLRELYDIDSSSSEQQYQWKGNFPGYTITQIRCYNVGRQRVWTSLISTSGSNGQVNLALAAYKSPRFFIDVYALAN